ncbi:hypothetical protein BDY19DRAFT_989282 [Irpex rosettiformis]|uniref:Uncharacterized protein n=1 Tax=Irpex rosettiformis TaxID=378272 RepID=A0ACB8UI46_9APHY|nr:hypothetical protein BDY19DRAFT_989282 [Irpex rosettiformis]
MAIRAPIPALWSPARRNEKTRDSLFGTHRRRPDNPVKRMLAAASSLECESTSLYNPSQMTVLAPPESLRFREPTDRRSIIQEAWHIADKLSVKQVQAERDKGFNRLAIQHGHKKVGIKKEALNKYFERAGLVISPRYNIQGDVEVWINTKSPSTGITPRSLRQKPIIRTAVVLSDDNILGLRYVRQGGFSAVVVTCSMTALHFARSRRIVSLYTSSDSSMPENLSRYLGEFVFVYRGTFSKGERGGDWDYLSELERDRMNTLGASNVQWCQIHNQVRNPNQIHVYILQWVAFDDNQQAALLSSEVVCVTQPQKRQRQDHRRIIRVLSENQKNGYLTDSQSFRKSQIAQEKERRGVLRPLTNIQENKSVHSKTGTQRVLSLR